MHFRRVHSRRRKAAQVAKTETPQNMHIKASISKTLLKKIEFEKTDVKKGSRTSKLG